MSRVDNPRDPDLDRRLTALARAVGDLPALEIEVGAALRRGAAATPADHPALEDLVAATLRTVQRADGRGRLRRLLWPAAVAASVAAVVLVLAWGRGRGEALASIESSQGCEVRSAADGRWKAPAGPVRLERGDEVRAISERAVLIRFVSGDRVILHPQSQLLLEGGDDRGGGRRLLTRLVRGGLDAQGTAGGKVVLLVRAGSSECRVADAHVQVLQQPDRGVIVAAWDGCASVRAAGRRRAVKAGTVVLVSARAGTGASITSFRLDDGALLELVHWIRRRWSRYVTRDDARRRTGVLTVTVRLSPRARNLSAPDLRARPAQVKVFRVPAARTGLREHARRFLAAHTADDRRFVFDALDESLAAGLPEIAARAVSALLLMGETRAAVAARIARVPVRVQERGREPGEMARAAARAALGDVEARAALERALDAAYSLETRALAVLGAAGQPDTALHSRVRALAEDSADDLYRDWRASADFCEAVGVALAGRADREGLALARDLVSDPSLPVKARRRYLSGVVRELADRPAVWQAFLLDLFPRLAAPRLRRAALTEFVRAEPLIRDAVVADFFRDLVEIGGASAPTALTGLALYAPAADRAVVECELLELLGASATPALRAGAARALGVLDERRCSRATLRALERALADPSDEVRYWAARTLGDVSGRDAGVSVAAVLEALTAESVERCRVALVDTLVGLDGAGDDPAVVRTLEHGLRGAEPRRVKSACARALGRLGTDEARLVLEDLAAFGDDPELRQAATDALAASRETRDDE